MSVRQLLKLYSFVFIGILILILLFILYLAFTEQQYNLSNIYKNLFASLDDKFVLFIIIGFIAQIIDGTLGMGYGVSSTSFLLSFGISPAMASASVHTAEIFTTGVSGFSHWKFKNVNKKLLFLLVFPGAIGAILGSLLLVYFDGNVLKPFMAIYLLIMGLRIMFKAFAKKKQKTIFKQYSILGFVGGFLDSSGGGGWGPVVTSTLIGAGRTPSITIGTVNTAEFIIAFVSSVVFAISLSFNYWQIIIGLILGGIIAAPVAAFLCQKIKTKTALILVGLLIIFLSLKTLLKYL